MVGNGGQGATESRVKLGKFALAPLLAPSQRRQNGKTCQHAHLSFLAASKTRRTAAQHRAAPSPWLSAPRTVRPSATCGSANETKPSEPTFTVQVSFLAPVIQSECSVGEHAQRSLVPISVTHSNLKSSRQQDRNVFAFTPTELSTDAAPDADNQRTAQSHIAIGPCAIEKVSHC